ncbi:hypothetical protein IMSHALPRED_004049 [Imshaugia aleurites]|uniref:Methyltransferase domain-containing protein n=1 Tax=Imshaugia aleurites TaxID=172621 RepID=A0A8H3EFX8_9LECA|nr:hypothetical protein IMSHALPRED_004049 [Imshaugia aleurites]
MATIDQYALDRSYSAASRLNYQFYLWKNTLKFNLHPSIPTPSATGRIADVATGTGIWLLDLAHEVPTTVRMDGLDITLSQTPPKQWLPPNINMRVWNIFTDLPEDLVGQFDIVHVRLLLLVIPDNDAVPVIKRLATMLKPGGYLQWEELSGFDHRVVTVSPAVNTSAFQEMHKLMDGHGRLEWTLRLPSSMSENGFEDADIHRYEDGMDLAKAHSDMLLVMLKEYAAGFAKSERGEEAGEMQRLIQHIHAESLEGAAMYVPKIVCVGRKKLDGAEAV